MNRAMASALGAYVLWGAFPLYVRLLDGVPTLEFVGHRAVWTLLLLVILTKILRMPLVPPRAKEWRTLGMVALSMVLLSINWLVYVYGVNVHRVLDCSLGYFLLPLVSIILGVFVLGEKLRPLQWVSAGLACVAVGIFTYNLGALPWLSLALAISFGLYGLVRKRSALDSRQGLLVETAMLFPFALVGLALWEFSGRGHFVSGTTWQAWLLAAAGVVTAVPLLLFGFAARGLPLSLTGMLQYITPSLQFLVGWLVFHESINRLRAVGFALVWASLGVLAWDLWRSSRTA